jgi:hypothetical protein
MSKSILVFLNSEGGFSGILFYLGPAGFFQTYLWITPHLTFGREFNQSLAVGVLPSTLTHLTFGFHFNQSMESGVLPASLTHLAFGHYFRQPLAAGVLPATLTHLHLEDNYRCPAPKLRQAHQKV